jgi:hypothetical protein
MAALLATRLLVNAPPPPVSISSCSPAHTLDQTLDFGLYINLLAYLSEYISPDRHSWILSISTLNHQ